MENKPATLVPLPPSYTDARGEILNILDLPIGSVSVITSTPGAVRANHYHKTDWHYCYMEKGAVDYYHRPVGSTETPEHFHIKQGGLFYTPPMFDHAMRFTEDSVMWCFARNPRTSADYEADTVRIPSIIPA
jgi:dTDP-4-dehydrorhamnose 3,5-epimerase-like enzyme